MKFIVSYSNGLRLSLADTHIEDFLKSSMWKLRMPAVKRRLSHTEGQTLVFPESLSYSECEHLLTALTNAENDGVEVELSPSFEEFKHREDSLIREKSKVGLLVKKHDASLAGRVQAFSKAIDSLMVRKLRDKQVWDAFFLCSMRKAANFSVPGSGKTASTLGMFAYLLFLKKVARLVVVCPKNAFGSWRDEWLNCFGDRVPCASLCFHDREYATKTTSAKRKELVWNYKRFNLILVNYEALLNYQDELRDIVAEDTMLVFDEIHKVKKVGGVRAKSALEVAKGASYVVALTGTPIPNSYADIYNMLNILYPEDYKTFFGFSPKMLLDPPDSEIERINLSLQPFFCRTNKSDLGVPPASPDIEIEIQASRPETILFYKLREIYRYDALALIIRLLQLESDPNMLLEALEPEEFDGVVGLDGSHNDPELDAFTEDMQPVIDACGPTTKTIECVRLASNLVRQGKPVIVWCFFKQSMYNLSSMLSEQGIRTAVINGLTPQDERDSILESFKSRGIDVLLTNPHTLAESVSLHSVCHDAIYFEYGYNLVHLLQSKDRIHRLGLPHHQYTQYYFLQSRFSSKTDGWSLDKKIYDRLAEKEQVMLEAIDKGILEIGSSDKDDIMVVFEGLFDLDEE